MLQIIREKAQGVIAWSIVGVIALVFAFLGLDNFFAAKNSNTVAAKVNGEKIYWSTIDHIYQGLYRQYAMRQDFDLDSLNANVMKAQIRTALVQQTALLDAAINSGYRVGNDELKQVLQTIPSFLQDGKFSPELYKLILQNNGLTDELYQNNLRKEILLSKLQQAIGSTAFSTDKEKIDIIKLLNQTRDFSYAVLDKDNFENKVNVADADLQDYYTKHQEDFIKPEQVKLSYIELNLKDIESSIKPDLEDVKKFYNDNIIRFTVPELFKLSHILISAPKGSKQEQDGSAKEKADQALIQLKQKSVKFEDMVKKYSDDSSTVDKAGDIGWVSRGDLDKNFEKNVFGLSKNEVSKVFQTDFGFHIVKVTDKQDKRIKSFDEVKEDVTKAFIQEQAEQILASKAEDLSNMVYENAEPLDEVAKELGLKVGETEIFSKEGALEGIGSLRKVVDKAFSEDIIKLGRNSDVIKINDETYIVIRLKQHYPSEQLAFVNVKDKVKKSVLEEKIIEAVTSKGESIVADINSKKDLNAIAKDNSFTWKQEKNISRGATDKVDDKIIQAAFGIAKDKSLGKLSAGAKLSNNNYAIVVLNDVHEGSIDKNAEHGLAESYAKHVAITLGRYEYNLYQDSVLNKAKIKLSDIPNN